MSAITKKVHELAKIDCLLHDGYTSEDAAKLTGQPELVYLYVHKFGNSEAFDKWLLKRINRWWNRPFYDIDMKYFVKNQEIRSIPLKGEAK